MVRRWNENNLNPLTRTNWRESLVPAAAVIPAPIAYLKVVAVKKLVVERVGVPGASLRRRPGWPIFVAVPWATAGWGVLYCEEIRVFKAGDRLDIAAWNNEIGPWAILLVAVRGNG
jgi:hypothetical protein